MNRNRVKRQVREYFRTHGDSLGCFDYNVVIPSIKKMEHPYSKRLGKCLRAHFLHAISTR